MDFGFLLLLLPAFLAVGAATVVGLSRHKKHAGLELNVVGKQGRVAQTLAPVGAVIVAGELWRATTEDGAHVASGQAVRVRGARGHLLVVEAIA